MGRIRSVAYLAVLLVALSACETPEAAPEAEGDPVEPETEPVAEEEEVDEPDEPEELDEVTVQMAFRWALAHQYSTYLVGVDAGIYERHGIRPEFVEGTGSITTVQLLATGDSEFGAAVTSNAVIEIASQGGDVKMLGGALPVISVAAISGEEVCVETPQDLVGRTVALPPGTTQAQLFPALLEANDIDPQSVEVVNVDATALIPGLLAGQYDAYLSFAASQVPTLRDEGVEPCWFPFYEHGVTVSPGEAIIANGAFIESNPDLVRRFVQAVEESHQYALEHPEETCEAGVSAYPDQITMDACLQTMEVILGDFEAAGLSVGEPLLCITEEQVATTVNLMVEYAELDAPLSFEDYVAVDFLPEDCPSP